MKTLAKIFVVIWCIIGIFLTLCIGLFYHARLSPNSSFKELCIETYDFVASRI